MNDKMIITWENFDYLTGNLHEKIVASSWTPDVIIGLVRGGSVPATVLSHKFNIPCINYRIAFRDFAQRDDMSPTIDWAHVFNKKVLIVDDINDSGETINYIKKLYNCSTTKFAVLFHNATSEASVDYFGTMIDKSEKDFWVIFPWEI